jgi:branched-chain amino acid transport system ATP-binding protein
MTPPANILSANTLLAVEHVEVRYGDLIGVADVSLDVPTGSMVALLGANGAGKTTTLNAIAGLIPATRGTITLDGARIDGRPAYAIVRKGLALSPEGWRLFVQVYAVFPRLAERRHQRAGTMSGGERQMLAIGRALMSDPRLLMLDEPSLGLAPAVVDVLYETLVRLHREGLTILLAEQAVEMALEVADHAYVLQVGQSVLSGPAREVAQDPEVQRIYLGLGAAAE